MLVNCRDSSVQTKPSRAQGVESGARNVHIFPKLDSNGVLSTLLDKLIKFGDWLQTVRMTFFTFSKFSHCCVACGDAVEWSGWILVFGLVTAVGKHNPVVHSFANDELFWQCYAIKYRQQHWISSASWFWLFCFFVFLCLFTYYLVQNIAICSYSFQKSSLLNVLCERRLSLLVYKPFQKCYVLLQCLLPW